MTNQQLIDALLRLDRNAEVRIEVQGQESFIKSIEYSTRFNPKITLIDDE